MQCPMTELVREGSKEEKPERGRGNVE